MPWIVAIAAARRHAPVTRTSTCCDAQRRHHGMISDHVHPVSHEPATWDLLLTHFTSTPPAPRLLSHEQNEPTATMSPWERVLARQEMPRIIRSHDNDELHRIGSMARLGPEPRRTTMPSCRIARGIQRDHVDAG